MAQIEDKDTYAELTDLQKRVVDELAKDPTAQNTQIAERADVSRSTVFNVKEHYPHIVETQIQRRKADADGDPFDGQLDVTTAAQAIQDRPTQPDTDDDSDAVDVERTDNERDTGRVAVELDESAVRDILAGGDPERVRAAVVEAVVGEVFAERAA